MSDPTDWRRFAGEDMRVAEWAYSEGIYNQACFHAQQAAEKALKAWLRGHGVEPPRTHKLAVLVTMLTDETLEPLAREAALMDRFYIPTRYPDALPGTLASGLPNEPDAREAIDVARRLLDRVDRDFDRAPPTDGGEGR